MKHIFIAAAFVVGLTSSPAFAQHSVHQPGQQDQRVQMQQSQHDQHGDGAMTQNSEAMQQHRAQMQQMRDLMQRARATEDAEERARLMDQH